MHRIHDSIETLKRYYPDADTDLVYKAYIFAAKMHRGQTRLSGEPYLSHPIEVAVVLANVKMDVVTVATGLLHDVLEDTDTTIEQLEELFGAEIAQLVDGVTKIDKIHFGSREEYQAENLRKMLLAMAKDIRVLIVKLADRLHNVRTLNYANEEHQKRVALETLEIYAPLANRLGLGLLKAELEDQSFRYLDAQTHQQLVEYVNETRPEHQRILETAKRELEKLLEEHAIQATVTGRQKHLYSIYRKMQSKGISFREVMDTIGLRVITNTKADCYSTLGLIHSTWKYIPNTFDDYITIPKANMYQSLHTAVIGPSAKPIEVQIRTWEMHHLAEEGIAAHWRYKEGKEKDEEYDKKFFGLRHILEWQQELNDPSEFVENLKIDLFPDEVYVFTPQGHVKCLPKGSTPVDFAYSVHTEIGHRCVGARVNERLVPLRTKLNNGDIIEILTQKSLHPGRDWLSFIITSKAKAKVKQFFRAKQREEEIQLGTELLEKALRKVNQKLSHLQKDGTLKRIAGELNTSGEEDILAAIGAQKVSVEQVLLKIAPEKEIAANKSEKDISEPLLKDTGRTEKSHSESTIKVRGVDNVLTRFGSCCKPLPGDKIIGYITRGRGITVHSVQCHNIRALEEDRKIEIEWDNAPNVFYPAEVFITGKPRHSLFADIIEMISKMKTDILSAASEPSVDQLEVRCVVNVLDRQHLENLMRGLRNVRSVTEVKQVGMFK